MRELPEFHCTLLDTARAGASIELLQMPNHIFFPDFSFSINTHHTQVDVQNSTRQIDYFYLSFFGSKFANGMESLTEELKWNNPKCHGRFHSSPPHLWRRPPARDDAGLDHVARELCAGSTLQQVADGAFLDAPL